MLSITITFSKEFEALIQGFLGKVSLPQSIPAVEVKKDEHPKPQTTTEDMPLDAYAHTDDKTAYTEMDVRMSLNSTRERLFGADWEKQAGSPIYLALNEKFKSLAKELGSDKPSSLPEDKRATFINACKMLKIEGNAIIG